MRIILALIAPAGALPALLPFAAPSVSSCAIARRDLAHPQWLLLLRPRGGATLANDDNDTDDNEDDEQNDCSDTGSDGSDYSGSDVDSSDGSSDGAGDDDHDGVDDIAARYGHTASTGRGRGRATAGLSRNPFAPAPTKVAASSLAGLGVRLLSDATSLGAALGSHAMDATRKAARDAKVRAPLPCVPVEPRGASRNAPPF